MLPFVRASITPDFSKYLRNSSFFESGVWKSRVARWRDGVGWYLVGCHEDWSRMRRTE